MSHSVTEKLRYEKDMYISEAGEQNLIRSYEHDRLYLQRIRHGKVDAILRHRAEEDTPPDAGRLVKDPHKHQEYMACVTITLAAYAALEGGLDPTSVYALSDLHLRRLEQCRSIEEIKQLVADMELLFAEEVCAVREKRSNASYVEKCKLFIDQHLGKLFTLDDLANTLNVNKSYLSRRFLQETGMRIMEYTRKKRIEAAANMLKYTDKTISNIAVSFCFPTQSHFGKWFKTLKGITPLKYRAANQVLEVQSGE